MRPTTPDADWLSPDDVDVAATTERPSALGVWRCDGEQYEPEQYPTLIQATGEKPATPEAKVYGGGLLLAECAADVLQWAFTAAGMRRIEAEMQSAVERDSDTCLATVLATDFAAVGT